MFGKLAEYPKIQEKIFQEIQEIIGNEDPKYQHIEKLTFLSYVINETLRMFPPAINVLKKATENTEIVGCAIPKGVNIRN